MKIKLVVFFMLLFKSAQFYGQSIENDLCGSFIETVMGMWTNIDIVRAINTDQTQKNIFLHDLITDSLDAYSLLRQIQAGHGTCTVQYDQDMEQLVASVLKSFKTVFHQVNNPDYYVFCFILRKIMSLLKTPQNVDSQIAT